MKPVMPIVTGTPSMVTTAPPRKRVLGPLDNASMLQPLEPLPQQMETQPSEVMTPAKSSSYMDVPLLEGTREGMRRVGKTLLEWGSSVVPRVPTVRVPISAPAVVASVKGLFKKKEEPETIPPSGNSTFIALAAMAAALACLIYITTSMVSTMVSLAGVVGVVYMYARRFY